MNIALEYDYSDFNGNYCQRLREFHVKRRSTPSETRKAVLETVYAVIPASVSWHITCTEAKKVILTAWGYGHALDGYTIASSD